MRDRPHQVGVGGATGEDLPAVLQVRQMEFPLEEGQIRHGLTLSTQGRAKNILSFTPFVSSPSSPESRKDFLKTIHSILREKHRRQLLKTESLPLNQQYVPFGGKRLCALKGARPAINRAGEFQSAAAFTLQQSHVPVS